MSAEASIEVVSRRRKSSRVPPAASTMRSSTLDSRSDCAPWPEADPTSSWSKIASTGTNPLDAESTSTASSASIPA
ncbi:Uncharacterised protein [Mycobacterium tuberculosis]|nr:Uncharacterised protein [Mycobacterium tuberculosis]CNU35109.1 Uncharacterised protein [Mycobacterium tuberculosis]COX17307.1 Uncharacterised protein [Mycobacterium tuberculosis]